MDTKQQRVALYSRVSSHEQATEGVSIEAQAAALRAYAGSQGWEIADEYIDAGFNGGTDERPALKRLLMDGSRHRFNIIAVCKLDRFFRNLRLLLNHLHSLEQLGIKFVATQEGLDTSTPYGKFAVQIMGVIAEFERGRIGERVRDSRQFLIARGDWAGGRTLYGYRWLHEERKWEVIAEEAGVVRHIYKLYIDNKNGIDSIAASLNEDGLRTRGGARWSYASVHQVLDHPAYKGRHQLGMAMPPIIDEDTWQRAQKRRRDARSVLRKPKGWLLQGMCFCGQCGNMLKCLHKKPREPRYYACRGRVHHVHKDGGKRCTLPYVRADELEWSAWRKVKEVLGSPDRLAECVSRALSDLEERRSQTGAEALAIDARLETVRAKAERLGMAFADGAVSGGTYKQRLSQLKKQQEALLKCRHNVDPSELTELAVLEEHISKVKDILSKGSLNLTEFGIFGAMGDEYVPAGFNALREPDGKLAIGEVAQADTFRIEGTDMVMRGIDVPSGFWEFGEKERDETIKRNMRAILQLFNIKVIIYPGRAEIRGAIPTQFLDIPGSKKPQTAPIISSPSPFLERGMGFDEGAPPLQTSLFAPPLQTSLPLTPVCGQGLRPSGTPH